jgi:hypothetical protein
VWGGAIGFNYDRPLANGMTLKASGVLSYVDKFFTEADLDPNVLQTSFQKIDLQIGVSSANDKWYVGIIGKNLTDEITTYHRNDVPLNTGTYYALTEPSRTFYLMARHSHLQESALVMTLCSLLRVQYSEARVMKNRRLRRLSSTIIGQPYSHFRLELKSLQRFSSLIPNLGVPCSNHGRGAI